MRLNFGTRGERPSQHCGGLYPRGVPARGHSRSRFERRASRTEPYSSRRRTGTAVWSSRRFRSPLEVFMQHGFATTMGDALQQSGVAFKERDFRSENAQGTTDPDGERLPRRP